MKIIKYLGSKSKLSKQIIPIIQECIDKNKVNTYIEPFVGGANIIDKIKCDNRIGSDINKYLIALFQNIKNSNIYIPTEITREHYNEVKLDYIQNESKFEDYYKGLIGFCGAFRGKFFDSCACFNYESEGRIRNNYKESLNNIIKQIPNIKTVDFNWCSYEKYKSSDFINTVFYCDIPYKNTYNYNIEFNYDNFYKWCREMSKNNFCFISEYEMPDDFDCIWQQEKKMCLQPQSERFIVTEKLFTYSNKLI